MSPETDKSLVLSYITLRRALGVIGMALPFALVALKYVFLDPPALLDSMSRYYYHGIAGDVFVGSLCAIAIFLFCYRGYDREDNLAGNFAGTFALGVALFPTTPVAGATDAQQVVGVIHLISALLFFSALAFFALHLFRKGSSSPTAMKLIRNKVYAACGGVIVACIFMLIANGLFPDLFSVPHTVFWLEAAAIFAFGVSWLVKGEAILGDTQIEQEPGMLKKA